MEVTLEQVAAQVSEVARQLGETEQRLKAHVDDAKEDLKHQAQANKEELKHQAQADKEELKHQAQANKEELKHQAQAYKEELKQEVTLGAEGYGATLDGIKRELADLNKKIDTRLGDHDLVLANHNERITMLEKDGCL